MLVLIAALMLTSVGPDGAAPSFDYVALGDSLGAGMGASRGYVTRLYERLRGERRGVALHNLSSSGSTTADVLRTQLPRLARLRPSLITLTVGTNDLTTGVPIAALSRQFAMIIGALSATGATVVVTNLPAVAWAPAVPAAYRSELDAQVRSANEALRAACERSGAIVFDLYALSRAEISRHPEYFSLDGYHPSDDGYERWAAAMWPQVKAALAHR